VNGLEVWRLNAFALLRVARELDLMETGSDEVGPHQREAFELARALTVDILGADGVWQESEALFAFQTGLFGQGPAAVEAISDAIEAAEDTLAICPEFLITAARHDNQGGTDWTQGLLNCLERMGFAAIVADQEAQDEEIRALEGFLWRARDYLETVEDAVLVAEIPTAEFLHSDPRSDFPGVSFEVRTENDVRSGTLSRRDEVAPTPSAAQLDAVEPAPAHTLSALLAELDAMTGLNDVKREVRAQASLIRVRQMRQEQGLATGHNALHLVFTGNPGTGKTTVARLLASILKALGTLKKGHLIETDRAGLVAKYLGQTAGTVDAKVKEALDGVLFIDEAYALTAGRHESDYGKEAVDALVKRMEDYRDRLVVIVAGYNEPMLSFIGSNPGLRSRFTHTIHFPDYGPEELHQILRSFASEAQYTLTPDADAAARGMLLEAWERRDEQFGNARDVRKFFERAVQLHSLRVAGYNRPTREQLTTITLADLPSGLSS